MTQPAGRPVIIRQPQVFYLGTGSSGEAPALLCRCCFRKSFVHQLIDLGVRDDTSGCGIFLSAGLLGSSPGLLRTVRACGRVSTFIPLGPLKQRLKPVNGRLNFTAGTSMAESWLCRDPPLQYQWWAGRSPVAGATDAVLAVVDARKALHQGLYAVQVRLFRVFSPTTIWHSSVR